MVLVLEHNLIPNKSELGQMAANSINVFTVFIYLFVIVRLVGPVQL